VPARSAPHVDDLGALTDTEVVEVDRQHGSPTACAESRTDSCRLIARS
jgi:hypothetical protein